ncbi:MAG: GTP-binding protein, partial [Candidatus Thorarchaeota archaeon]|nr:GTP-binding protein [Candidatus Thorarchaeota archaeon]
MSNMIRRPSIFKTVLIGEGGVGKTSITVRYTENRFEDDMRITIGANFASKRLDVDGVPVTLMLWDLGGQPRFRDVVSDYFMGSKFAIAVYDVTRPVSLDRLSEWIDVLKANSPSCDLIFVGNKADERNNGYGVSLDEARLFAARYGA